MMLAQALYSDYENFTGAWNFGPDQASCVPVNTIINIFQKFYGSDVNVEYDIAINPHEAKLLMLDNSKSRQLLGWEIKYGLEETFMNTAHWYKEYYEHVSASVLTINQIESFIGAAE